MSSSTQSKKKVSLWLYTYGSRPLKEEYAYRKHYLDNDIKQTSAIIYTSLAFLLVLTLIDLPNLSTDSTLYSRVFVRTAAMCMGMVSVWLIGHYRRPSILDRVILIHATLLAIGALAVHWSGDSSATRILGAIMLFVLAGHIAFPTYAVWLAFPITILLIGEGYLIFSSSQSDRVSNRAFIVAIAIFSEIIGVIASAYFHQARYQTFKALREVKTLSGLLPICASCKNIRDDQGYYQRIEHYLTKHSDAKFSHGICPDCLDKLYPQLNTNTK